MKYEYISPNVNRFVHRLVTGYVVHGYVFWYQGRIAARIPEEELEAVDLRIIKRFGCDKSYRTRVRRKRAGLANCHYQRLGGTRDFVIVSTHGMGSKLGDMHPFFEAYGEKRNGRDEVVRKKEFRDFRHTPLRFHGYSISLKPEGGKPKRGTATGGRLRGSVRIHMEEYRSLKAYFLERAKHRSTPEMVDLFGSLPYHVYAPVQVQLKNILRACNKARKQRGFDPIPLSAVPRKRRAVRAPELPREELQAAA